MQKTLILLIVSIFLIGFGCSKKSVSTLPEISQVVPAEAEALPEESLSEPSIRSTEWTSVPQLETAFFEFDKYDLSAEAREVLSRNAQFMNAQSNVIYKVEGHCDDRGTVEYNLALGQRRAMAVRDYYSKLGVPLDAVATISYGEEKPAVEGASEDARAKNRRAETMARAKEKIAAAVPKNEALEKAVSENESSEAADTEKPAEE